MRRLAAFAVIACLALPAAAPAQDRQQTLADIRQALTVLVPCRVLPEGAVPHTRHVRGSNFNLISVFPDRLPGRAIVLSVIDNVCKGASGQALQNMNLLLGCPETTSLDIMPVFP